MKKIIILEYAYVLNRYELEVEVDDETFKKLESDELDIQTFIDNGGLNYNETLSQDVIYDDSYTDNYVYGGESC